MVSLWFPYKTLRKARPFMARRAINKPLVSCISCRQIANPEFFEDEHFAMDRAKIHEAFRRV